MGLRPIAIFSFTISLMAGCSAQSPAPSSQAAAQNADDLLIVDCLLPGQVKRLGSHSTYLTARRPIKTSAVDCQIRGGEYVAFDRADYATALKIWLPMAQGGDPEAQTYVGEIYEKGLGLAPDYKMAAHWYRLAGEQGLARALINLGNLYEKGLGVTTDKAKALNLYRLAAGLPDDELLYASTVAANAVDQQQLAQLQQQVREQNTRLEQAQANLAQSQQQLARQKSLLAQAKEQQQDAKLKLYAQESKKIHEQSQALINQLRATLNAAEAKVVAQEQELAQAAAQLQQNQGTLLESERQAENGQLEMAKAKALPVIEIIDPPMTLTRGLPTIPVPNGTQTKEIIGKIQAPAGLTSFMVNGVEQKLDEYDLFWVKVPLQETRTPVKLEARDSDGNVVNLNFNVVAQANSTPAQPLATGKPEPIAGDSQFNLGQYHALVIGNNDYRAYPKLQTAVNDAQTTANLLRERFGFNTRVLQNATRYEMLAALNELRKQLTPSDNLLIYYAGHGELDNSGDAGFWLPVDAEVENPRNWISNAAISDILNTIQAKHIMVVADSCYAGTLSVTATPRMIGTMPTAKQQAWVEAMVAAKARTVLTSGGVAPVLDGGGGGHSVFARAFIEALQNTDGLVEGHAIYQQVLQRVKASSKTLDQQQIPEYAPARHAGHEAGEFFFRSLTG